MSTPLILVGAFARERRQRLTVNLGVMRERPQSGRQLESSDSNGWCWDSRNRRASCHWRHSRYGEERPGRATRRLVEHIGFAYTEGDLTTLTAVTRDRIDADQTRLELELEPESQIRAGWDAVVRSHSSEVLWGLTGTYSALGFDEIGDETTKVASMRPTDRAE
ncbi:hypothetical protein [Rhodococcus sp. NCIMB 12038]|uniref:hypothetical protein n=1 Tax=Rhodococcus sp. NCIMB 12038 TaxID=933800 RepID=UPI00267FBE5C